MNGKSKIGRCTKHKKSIIFIGRKKKQILSRPSGKREVRESSTIVSHHLENLSSVLRSWEKTVIAALSC